MFTSFLQLQLWFFSPFGRNKSSDRHKERESWVRIAHTQVLERVQDRGSRFLGFSFVAHSAGENKCWVLVDLHRGLRVKLTEIRQKVCMIQPTKYTACSSLSTEVKGLSAQPTPDASENLKRSYRLSTGKNRFFVSYTELNFLLE